MREERGDKSFEFNDFILVFSYWQLDNKLWNCINWKSLMKLSIIIADYIETQKLNRFKWLLQSNCGKDIVVWYQDLVYLRNENGREREERLFPNYVVAYNWYIQDRKIWYSSILEIYK